MTGFTEWLRDRLPHGSGIDCPWVFTWQKNGKLRIHNSYHFMNEHGYYDGYLPFTVILDLANQSWRFEFNGLNSSGKRKAETLRDYLEDTLAWAFADMGIC